MVRVFSPNKGVAKTESIAPSVNTMNLSDFGADSARLMDSISKAKHVEGSITIGNAERPSNLWYKVTSQSSYWYMYALMDWYKSEVSILSTIINRATAELFRYDLELRPKFALKCEDCGCECQNLVTHCPACNSTHMRKPDPLQKKYFTRPNGSPGGISVLEEANENGQALIDVLKAYANSEYQNNQAYTLCVTGDIFNEKTGKLIKNYPLEFLPLDPKFVKDLYDDTGKPGTLYAFTRDDRHTLISFETDEDALNAVNDEGKELYPAYWQVGSNYGATGRTWLYSKEEIYQDHWFTQSLIYGIPIWFDIEDDLLTYHYIEKHNLKKYKYGYVRKLVVLPGFSEDDVEDITKGITDVLATNDNSIPIICLPPQIPGTAEMKAQTLELGTESSSDLMQIKDDIRDRLCAHVGVPNLFVGDVEASGGMNNESQQITVFDRHLMDKYNYIDRQCRWIMSFYPMITDYELVVSRPSKAYTDTKRRMDKIQEAQAMKSLGYNIKLIDNEFRYDVEPQDQKDAREQKQQQAQQQQMGGGMMDGGLMPGDGQGPPEKGTPRREDGEVGGSADEVDLAKREAISAFAESAGE